MLLFLLSEFVVNVPVLAVGELANVIPVGNDANRLSFTLTFTESPVPAELSNVIAYVSNSPCSAILVRTQIFGALFI